MQCPKQMRVYGLPKSVYSLRKSGGSGMGNITGLLIVISILISCEWVTDMSTRDELKGIRRELKRIADSMEQREKDG